MKQTALAALVLSLLCQLSVSRAQPPEAAAQPNLILRRTVQFANNHHILSLPFQVPAGTTRITMNFTYTGQEQRTALDLGLMGPDGFRGWSGGDKDGFTLSASDATPSYLPGPIEPGTWTLLLGVPNIRQNVTSQFTAEVYFNRPGRQELVVRPGPAWYRGDLHMHTAHSDGSCKSRMGRKVPCPLFLTVQAALDRGLDFIAITDHNTQSHYDPERELQPYFDNILLLPGREMTTYQGHANLFGTTEFVDFRIGTPQVPDVNTMLRQAQSLGAVMSINHPASPSGENCMGCGWTPDSPVDYQLIQAVEVVNGRHADGPRSGVAFWEGLLNRGYHLTGIGGSDNHDADIPIPGPGSIGYPTTVLHAADLSTSALLTALRAGHGFIDTEGSKDRLLEYSATVGSHHAEMGDSLPTPQDATIHLLVHVTHAGGAHLELIADGVKQTLGESAVIRDDDQQTQLDLAENNQRHWFRVEVCTAAGHRLLIGNPIYLSH
jgi:hypothetical protein